MWAEMLAYHALRRPDAPFLAGRSGPFLSYAESAEIVARRAGALARRGVEPGDRVVLVGDNSPDYLLTMLAISHVGAVVVPVNTRLSAHEVAFVVDHAQARLVVADPAQLPLVEAALGQLDGDRPVITLLDDLEDGDARPLARRGDDDLARIMYTSGTTGRPKGVMVTNGNVRAKCLAHAQEMALGRGTGLVVGPLYHAGALDITVTNTTYAGGSLRVHDRFDTEAAIGAFESGEIDHVWFAPVMLDRILDAAEARGLVLHRPRVMVGGGAATNPARFARIHAVFPDTWYADVYGLTETVSGDTVLPDGGERDHVGSVGIAVSTVEIAIVDTDGEHQPIGATGEIALRGAKVSPGYWRDPEATERTRVDGWFRTGDLGHLDDDGHLYVDGRLKDMIISGGENVAAAEVEYALDAHPDVVEVAVVGRPDDRWGEVPVAYVVARVEDLDVDALRAHVAERLARFKVPRDIHVVPALPRNPSGKVQKHLLHAPDETETP